MNINDILKSLTTASTTPTVVETSKADANAERAVVYRLQELLAATTSTPLLTLRARQNTITHPDGRKGLFAGWSPSGQPYFVFRPRGADDEKSLNGDADTVYNTHRLANRLTGVTEKVQQVVLKLLDSGIELTPYIYPDDKELPMSKATTKTSTVERSNPTKPPSAAPPSAAPPSAVPAPTAAPAVPPPKPVGAPKAATPPKPPKGTQKDLHAVVAQPELTGDNPRVNFVIQHGTLESNGNIARQNVGEYAIMLGNIAPPAAMQLMSSALASLVRLKTRTKSPQERADMLGEIAIQLQQGDMTLFNKKNKAKKPRVSKAYPLPIQALASAYALPLLTAKGRWETFTKEQQAQVMALPKVSAALDKLKAGDNNMHSLDSDLATVND